MFIVRTIAIVIVKLLSIGNTFFFILVDESHDLSKNEQIVIVLRYMDKNWHVIKHF